MAAAALVAVAPWLARAQDEPLPWTLTYGATMSCPSQQSFTDRVRARLGPVRRGDATDTAVDVRLTEDGNGARGRLALRSGARSSVRSVSGKDCDEVAAALALVLVLTLAPISTPTSTPTGAPTSGPSGVGEPPASTPSAAASVTASAVSTASSTAASIAAPAATAPASRPPPAPEGIHASHYAFEAFATASLRHGLLPSLAPSFGVGVGFGPMHGGFFSPAVWLALQVAPEQALSLEGGTVATRYVGGRMDLCPSQVRFSATFALRPCAVVELGALHNGASGFDAAQSRDDLWASAGAALTALWSPVPDLFLALSGDIAGTLVQRRFKIGATTAYEIAPWAAQGGVRVGLRLR